MGDQREPHVGDHQPIVQGDLDVELEGVHTDRERLSWTSTGLEIMAVCVTKRPYNRRNGRSTVAVHESACGNLYEVQLRRSTLLILSSIVLSACAEQAPPAETSVELTIAYDSTMGVDRLVVWGTSEAGTTRIDQHSLEAPYSLDPPGLRQAPIDLVVRDALEGETVVLRVDGRTADGSVVGSGATSVAVEVDRSVSALVTLGAPIVCGDGHRSNLEACDDGNQIAGDGCSDVCTLEPGSEQCGDGITAGTEECDDGNNADGDGCSAACRLEAQGAYVYEVERLEPATTTSIDFVDVPGATLTFVPNGPSDRWVVFVSGVLGSSNPSPVTAEMRLLINGIEVDHFGHQTLGTDDNDAGFLTFETITGATEEQVITPQFRAEVGTTRVASLRVVTVLVPPGADFQYAKQDEILEATGEGLDLARIDFTPAKPGEYAILAKGNLTELPSASTAQIWLEDDHGVAHPLQGFSSPRAAWLPAFVSMTETLDETPKSFVVRGTSSGTATLADWWDESFSMRQPIVITAPPDGLPAGYPVSVRFDHAAQAALGRSLPDGSDVWVVARLDDGTLAPIDRVVDETSSWNRSDTQIWFDTVPGVTPAYWLYWSSARPAVPPADPERVFPFFDTFEGTQLDPLRWSGRTAAVQNGQLVLSGNASVQSGGTYGSNTLWEAQIASISNGQVGTGGLVELLTGNPDGNDTGSGVGFYGLGPALIAQAGTNQTALQLMDPLATHILGFARRSGADVTFYDDGQPVASLAEPVFATPDLRVRMSNPDPNFALVYDWVRIRPIVAAEPLVELGAIEGRAGASPSQWRNRKLMAFRTDVFLRAFSAAADANVSTMTDTPVTLTSLEVPAPPTEVDELVIASARVSGESSATGRKSGEVRADGEILVRTAHRINRDSSRTSGYHHVVGVADARHTSASARYQVDIRSPDGIEVDGAGASILVLSYPSRR